jgi:hypothetical protein
VRTLVALDGTDALEPGDASSGSAFLKRDPAIRPVVEIDDVGASEVVSKVDHQRQKSGRLTDIRPVNCPIN